MDTMICGPKLRQGPKWHDASVILFIYSFNFLPQVGGHLNKIVEIILYFLHITI